MHTFDFSIQGAFEIKVAGMENKKVISDLEKDYNEEVSSHDVEKSSIMETMKKVENV